MLNCYEKIYRQYKIKHIAILFGPTGIKSHDGRRLVLHGLDTDGEVFDSNEIKKKIIEDLKTKTMTIKTRKPWGHLVLWFEHSRYHIPVQSIRLYKPVSLFRNKMSK